ncbi:hypothetical protein ACWGKW_42530 [Streptomyces sp. NPDC054766]
MTSRPADPSGLTTHNLAALMPPEFWESQARYDRVSRHRKQNNSGTGQIPRAHPADPPGSTRRADWHTVTVICRSAGRRPQA